MKKLLILSGKGGTGKTTLSSAMIRLTKTDVYADCDVDAPNLHLIGNSMEQPTERDYIGMPKAVIDDRSCVGCGLCEDACRFDAISSVATHYQVNPYACEGCSVCQFVCPASAVIMKPWAAGVLRLYDEGRYFSSAKLYMGSGNSGKLVSEVKKQLNDYTGNSQVTIIDGSPGIGCPVIASVSGVDMVLVVAEPSLSGFSDMERILSTAAHFRTPAAVCVNKSDINTDMTNRIIAYCDKCDIPFVGTIPYDNTIPMLLNEGKTVLDVPSEAANHVRQVYKETVALL